MIYRKIRLKPIPPGSTPKSRRGVAGVEWTDGRGRVRWAPLHADGIRIALTDARFTLQHRDASGKLCETSTGTSDEATAREIAAAMEQRVARQRRGIEDPIADTYAGAGRDAADDHLRGRPGLTGYRQWLEAKGRTKRHVGQTVERIGRVLKAAKINTLADLDSAKIARAIRSAKSGAVSNATFNAYVRACRAFSTWLWRRKRLRDDVLRDLELADAAVGRTLFRRELTDAELEKIIAEAEKSDSVKIGRKRKVKQRRLSGRAWAYRIAVETGFRASEIASLRRESFDLDTSPPTVTVEAAYSKRRRRDTQPVSRAFAEMLRPWLATMPHGEPLFAGHTRWGAAIKVDAKAAGVPLKTTKGTLDFHALRHTYASRIAAVADAKTGQSLTRHASADLYLTVYAKQREASRAAAVEAASRQASRQSP